MVALALNTSRVSPVGLPGAVSRRLLALWA